MQVRHTSEERGEPKEKRKGEKQTSLVEMQMAYIIALLCKPFSPTIAAR